MTAPPPAALAAAEEIAAALNADHGNRMLMSLVRSGHASPNVATLAAIIAKHHPAPADPWPDDAVAVDIDVLEAERARHVAPPANAGMLAQMRAALEPLAKKAEEGQLGQSAVWVRNEWLLACAEALSAAGTEAWQPIETAPKDGTEVLLLGPCRPRNSRTRYATDANVGWWEGGHWSTRVAGEVCDATGWLPIPLPSPPAERRA